MLHLTHDDMQRVLGFLPKDLVALLKAHPIILAGGYIRSKIIGEEVSDIDMFVSSPELADVHAKALATDRQGKAFRTKNAWTVLAQPRVPVQFIHRWTFTDPALLLQSFDFTVARACIFWDKQTSLWQSQIDPLFYSDLAARRLRYCQPDRNEDAGGSILRVQKFLKRGYDISPEQFGAVIARLIDKVNPDTGMWNMNETGKAKVITGLLREVDPLTVIDGLEPSADSLEEDD